jgi:hypothetical protein
VSKCHNIAKIILSGCKADIIIPSRKATITHSRNPYSSLVIECHNIADIILLGRKAEILYDKGELYQLYG